MQNSYSGLAKELVTMLHGDKGDSNKKFLNEALAAVSRAEAAEAEARHFSNVISVMRASGS